MGKTKGIRGEYPLLDFGLNLSSDPGLLYTNEDDDNDIGVDRPVLLLAFSAAFRNVIVYSRRNRNNNNKKANVLKPCVDITNTRALNTLLSGNPTECVVHPVNVEQKDMNKNE
jgi:hypothetical protein